MEGLQNHDTECAKELSGELSQIRKMIKIISSARLSLEQIKLRLETVTDLGDVAWGATPSDVRRKWNTKRISSMILEADQLFNQISDLLGSVRDKSEQSSVKEMTGFGSLNEDSAIIIA